MHIHNWGYSILYMYYCGAIYLFLIVSYKPILIPGMIVSNVQKLGCDWLLQWVLLPREFGTVIIHSGIPFKDIRDSQKDAGVSRVYVDDRYLLISRFSILHILSLLWDHPWPLQWWLPLSVSGEHGRMARGSGEGESLGGLTLGWHWDWDCGKSGVTHLGSPVFNGGSGSPLSSRIGFQRQRRGIELLNNRGGISVVNHGEQIPELRGGFVMENDWIK